MAELLLELFSEEIPARMQAGGAESLARLLGEALMALAPRIETFYGPRRIAAVADVLPEMPAAVRTERGPRSAAPEAALAGFLRKHGATRDQLTAEGDYWVLRIESSTRPAAALIAEAMPGLLRRFPWPKSMRWGGTSAFTWVRPLRRILCVLDGDVVPFDLRDGADDGHGLASGNLTEGHRFMSPGAVAISGAADWRETLTARHVMVDAAARRGAIGQGLTRVAGARGLTVVPDEGLLDEVTGLVDWPVPLLGRIDAALMDLPPEVMQVSMRVNQRYFALRDAEGRAAPFFGFVANIETADRGAAIIAGNERVLRARFADARHFWDIDRATSLQDRITALSNITFHAKLGSQLDRVTRLRNLAGEIAWQIDRNAVEDAKRAAYLSKADLTTGMVGEFPELQGIMGGYYAVHDGETQAVAAAIREHYVPKGTDDELPSGSAGVAVALADRFDLITGFFAIGEPPTGSGDPYALRRAAQGVIQIVRRNHLTLFLRHWIETAGLAHNRALAVEAVFNFFKERLRVQLKAEGARYDVFNAVVTAQDSDDFVRLLERGAAVERFLEKDDGRDLLAVYRRAANILRIEEAKDGVKQGAANWGLFEPAERELALAIGEATKHNPLLVNDDERAMEQLATLRRPLDRFFETVKVNDYGKAELRDNRLRLLGQVVHHINQVADFSKIEG